MGTESIKNHLKHQMGLENLNLPQYNEIILNDDEKSKLLKTESLIKVLTPAEENEILRIARGRKWAKKKESEYWDKINAVKEVVKYTKDQLFQVIKNKANSSIKLKKGNDFSFEIDQWNRDILNMLCEYFTASPEFEKKGMSLKKGILLWGPVGCGKTFIQWLFSQNQVQSFKIISCRTVGYDYSSQGFDSLQKYSSMISIPENIFGQNSLGYCFDDLGTDEERKHYGDQINPMQEVILNRYDKIPFTHTHITTNLNVETIEEYYGSRVRNRVREMFNIISFDPQSPSRRK